jgi:hypothetical protein
MLETLIDTPIETRDAIVYGALALILLLLLRISSRLRRIIRLIEPKRERPTAPDGQPSATDSRYMREETLAEFLQRQREGG